MFVVTPILFDFFPQDKEAKTGKAEEKEGQEGSDLKGQENLGENEAGSKDEDSETDYSSEDEEILTKAGRPMRLLCRRLCGLLCWCRWAHSAGMCCIRLSLHRPSCQGLILCGQPLLPHPQLHRALALLQLTCLG